MCKPEASSSTKKHNKANKTKNMFLKEKAMSEV